MSWSKRSGSEFSGDVTFMAQLPKQVTPPSVVVSPGDTYLEPREVAGPLIREHWVVLVAVSTKNMAGGLATMRENSPPGPQSREYGGCGLDGSIRSPASR